MLPICYDKDSQGSTSKSNQIKNQAAIVRGQKDTDKSDLKVVDAGPGMQRGERRKKNKIKLGPRKIFCSPEF